MCNTALVMGIIGTLLAQETMKNGISLGSPITVPGTPEEVERRRKELLDAIPSIRPVFDSKWANDPDRGLISFDDDPPDEDDAEDDDDGSWIHLFRD